MRATGSAVAAATARDEIENLLERYCWTVDHGRLDEWGECFTVDGVLHIRDTVLVGREAIRTEMGRRLQSRFRFLRHLPHPASVSLLDDEHAAARSYFEVRGRAADGRDVEALGEYHDDIVKTAEGWQFARRRIEITYFVHRGEPWEGDLFAT